jgi:hypothetical protein
MNRLPANSIACLLIATMAGCRTAPAPANSANPTPQPSTPSAQPAAAGQPASPVKPPPAPEPQVDQDSPAGVRGSQNIKLFVSLAGKPVESAHLTVRSIAGKVEAKGRTDNWGELHASLNPGHYKVTIDSKGKTVMKYITINQNSEEVDLKLDAPPT